MSAADLQSRYDPPLFHGDSFVAELDEKRLTRQLDKVRACLLAGEQHTLASLAGSVGCSEASASARIRDVRREGIAGGWVIQKKRITNGLWEYWAENTEGGSADAK